MILRLYLAWSLTFPTLFHAIKSSIGVASLRIVIEIDSLDAQVYTDYMTQQATVFS